MSAKDVVSKAKEAGIALNEKYVYNVRSSSGGSSKRPGRKPRATGVAVAAGRAGHHIEELLHAAASEIGLSRAISLLQQRLQVVRSALGR
jgi:hypothetical protein